MRRKHSFHDVLFTNGKSFEKRLRLQPGLILPFSGDQASRGVDGQGRKSAEEILEAKAFIKEKFF
jgi:hypothetical protein